MISLSSLILTPIDFLKACVRASVLDISYENISDAEIIVNGVSSPKDLAIPIIRHGTSGQSRKERTRPGQVRFESGGIGDVPMAMAVFPVPGGPAIKTARPAIFPSLIICRTMPADFLALSWPTMPCEEKRGWRVSSRPIPRMWEWLPILSTVMDKSLVSATVDTVFCVLRL